MLVVKELRNAETGIEEEIKIYQKESGVTVNVTSVGQRRSLKGKTLSRLEMVECETAKHTVMQSYYHYHKYRYGLPGDFKPNMDSKRQDLRLPRGSKSNMDQSDENNFSADARMTRSLEKVSEMCGKYPVCMATHQ